MFFALLALGEASPLVTNGFSSWSISSTHDMLWKTCFILHNIDETNVDLKLYDKRFFALLGLCVEFPLVAGGLYFKVFSCMGYWTNKRIASDVKSPDAHVMSLLLIFFHDNDESMINLLFWNCMINAFRIADPFWGDSGGHRWILLIQEQWGGNLMHSCIFPVCTAEQTI